MKKKACLIIAFVCILFYSVYAGSMNTHFALHYKQLNINVLTANKTVESNPSTLFLTYHYLFLMIQNTSAYNINMHKTFINNSFTPESSFIFLDTQPTINVRLELMFVALLVLLIVFFWNIKLRKKIKVKTNELQQRLKTIFENEKLSNTIRQLEEEVKLRQKIQLQLEESEEMLRAYINKSSEGIDIIDENGIITEWNPQMENISGVKAEEAIGQYVWDIETELLRNIPDNRFTVDNIKETLKSIIENNNDNQIYTSQTDIQDRQGTTKHIELKYFPIKTSKKKFIGRIARDLSTQNKIEKELDQYREKLEFLLALQSEKSHILTIQLNYIFENTKELILIIEKGKDEKWRVSRCNKSLSQMLNVDSKSIQDMLLLEFVDNQQYELIEPLAEEIIRTKQTKHFSNISFYYRNIPFFIDLTVIPIADFPGQVAFFMHDVTLQQEMLSTIKQREAFLVSILDNTPMEMWAVDTDSRLIMLNELVTKRFGKSALHIEDLEIHPELKKTLVQNCQVALLDNTVANEIEYDENGKKHVLFTKVSPIKIDQEIIGAIGINMDISENKEMITKNIESERKFFSVFNNSSDVISLIDYETGKYVEVNNEFLLGIRRNREEVIGKTRKELNTWVDKDSIEIYNNLLKIQGFIKNFEMRWNTIYGPRYYLISSEIVFVNSRKLILTNSKDIHDLKMLTIALKENEERLNTIMGSITNYVFQAIVDENKKVNIVHNEACIGYTGYSIKEFSHSSSWGLQIIYEKDQNRVIDFFKNIENNNNGTIEYRFVHKNSTLRWTRNTVVKIKETPENTEYNIIANDITEQKLLEQKIVLSTIEAEERERKKIAADLHDEVGPLLSSLNMNLSLLARKHSNEESIVLFKEVSTILKETIGSVREISHNISPQVLGRYGLISAIDFFIAGKKNYFEFNIESNLNSCRFNEIHELMLYRITKELINNTIKYSNAQKVEININKFDNTIKFFYADNGVGCDLKLLNESTRKGIGLLNIVERIESIGGHYNMNSEPGKGFSLYIEIKQNLN